MADQDTAKAIYAYCLRLLTRREHSRKELLNKCVNKGFTQADCEPVLTELAAQGWQDDLRYAESYAKQRIQKGFGPLAICSELNRSGVRLESPDSFLQAIAEDWLVVLERVYRDKYPLEPCLSYPEWAKRCRFLYQRGFPPDMIQTVFDQLAISYPKFK